MTTKKNKSACSKAGHDLKKRRTSKAGRDLEACGSNRTAAAKKPAGKKPGAKKAAGRKAAPKKSQSACSAAGSELAKKHTSKAGKALEACGQNGGAAKPASKKAKSAKSAAPERTSEQTECSSAAWRLAMGGRGAKKASKKLLTCGGKGQGKGKKGMARQDNPSPTTRLSFVLQQLSVPGADKTPVKIELQNSSGTRRMVRGVVQREGTDFSVPRRKGKDIPLDLSQIVRVCATWGTCYYDRSEDQSASDAETRRFLRDDIARQDNPSGTGKTKPVAQQAVDPSIVTRVNRVEKRMQGQQKRLKSVENNTSRALQALAGKGQLGKSGTF